MTVKDKLHCCRICGLYYDNYYPWGDDGTCPTYDYCICCHVEFGVDDYYEDTLVEYRIQWLKKGAKWAEKKLCPPNWNLKEQLENIMSSEEAEQLLEQYLSDNESHKETSIHNIERIMRKRNKADKSETFYSEFILNNNMQDWELLIQRCPGHEDEYLEADWQKMVEGVVESFSKYTGIPFSFTEPHWFFLDQTDPCAGFSLIHKVSTPIEPLIYYARGSIGTYYADDKKPTLYYIIDHPSGGIATCYVNDEKRERGISVSILLFLYFGEKRLVGENPDRKQNDDYIAFEYVMEPNNCYWKNCGWDCGFESEWKGLKY